jgi:hypothetical protein
MRILILFFILIAAVFTSCKKDTQRDKLLQGNWKLNKITVFDYDGISYSTDTTCSGSLAVNKDLDTSFDFNLAFAISSVFSDTTIAKGKYTLQEDGEYFSHNFLSVTNNNPIPGSYSRILFLTDKFFKWEYISYSGIRYHLIFEKIN